MPIGFTGTQLFDMNLAAAGIECFGVDLIAVRGHGQGCRDILFLRVGTSHIEDHIFAGTSVGNIEFVDFNGRIGHAQVKTLGTQGVAGQRLGHETQP